MDHEPINLDPKPVPPQLTPFNTERAREAGRKSGEARRAKALLKASHNLEATRTIETLCTTYERNTLGPASAAAAQDIIRRTVTGEIKPQYFDKAARLIEALTGVARLEAGQATAHTAHVSASSEDMLKILREAQESRG